MDVSPDSGGSKHSCTLVSPQFSQLSERQPIWELHASTPNLGGRLYVFTCVHAYLRTRVYIQRTHLCLCGQLQFTKGSRKTGFIQTSKRVGLFLGLAMAPAPSRFRALYPPLLIGESCGKPQRGKRVKSLSERAECQTQTCEAPPLATWQRNQFLRLLWPRSGRGDKLVEKQRPPTVSGAPCQAPTTRMTWEHPRASSPRLLSRAGEGVLVIQTWAKPEVARCHHGLSDHPLGNVAAKRPAGSLALRSLHCLEAL